MRAKFALLCIHGLGLHSGSFSDFGKRMAKLGGVIYAIDVRGFGSWMKAQGHQEIDFNACLEDIRSALVAIHRAEPGLPVFLLGESMGGAIALRAATNYPELINGVVSAVPAGDRFKQKRTDLKVAIQFLTGPKRQSKRIGKQVVEQAATARDPDGKKVVDERLVQQWEDDPLNRLDLSPMDLLQFQRFMNDNYDAVRKMTVPVLFVQGLDDDLVRPDGTWDLLKQVGVQDRTFIGIPARHLMFEEADTEDPHLRRAAVLSAYSWIMSHTDNDAPGQTQVAGQPSPTTIPSLAGGAPTVVAFYAPWCNQCRKLETFLKMAPTVAGNAVRFVPVNVDDPTNQELVRQLQVGALPQVMFVRPDGTIASSVIGETTAPVIIQHIADLLNIKLPAAN